MALLVKKFGGTSVASVERIEAVAELVAQSVLQGDQVCVVVSAMSGETNRLVGLAQQVNQQPDPEALDTLLATGEQVTIALLAMALKKRGIRCQPFNGAQAGIKTTAVHTKARVQSIETSAMQSLLQAGGVPIVTGFQGVTGSGAITTLGRGGSDTSAVAMAAALGAHECQIYTDVDGVYTTDPRVVSHARKMDNITFEEMLELASLGAKVLQIRSVELAGNHNVPLRVLSSFKPGKGTLISFDRDQKMLENVKVSGVAFNKNEAKVQICGLKNRPGVAASVLQILGAEHIDVDMIAQSAPINDEANLGFTVDRNELERVSSLLESNKQVLEYQALDVDAAVVKVSVVGVGMRSHAGVAATMFEQLSEVGINIEMITTSEIKISVLIEEKFLELAVRVLHDAFELEKPPIERAL